MPDCESCCPALILLDAQMPVMNGLALLKACAQLLLAHLSEAVIIVILTTSLHPRDVEQVQQLHIAGFLNKPPSRGKINGVLQEHFARHLPAA